jgi:hypothetical protein
MKRSHWPLILLALAACNAPPTAPIVAIAPLKARTDAVLKASIVTPSADPQGDAITYTFAWLKNNAPQNDLRTDTVT